MEKETELSVTDVHANDTKQSNKWKQSGQWIDADDAELAPDGGWGWAVVAASFTAHAIADGCTYSFGVLFVELLDAFNESRATTAWIGSLFVAMPSICAPIASALTARYGCRRTTIAGGLIAAFGCIISIFANSVAILCITFGIIAGFGLALVFIPAALVVAFYFNKRRATATGLALAGSGIGTFIFAPLTEYLIDQYSWRGALLVIGGLMLNIVICGAIFRPLTKPVESSESFELGDARSCQGIRSIYGTQPSETARSLMELPTYMSDNDLSSDPTVNDAWEFFSVKSNANRLHTLQLQHHICNYYRSNILYRGGILRAKILFPEERWNSCPEIFIHANQEDTVDEHSCHKLVRFMTTTFDVSTFCNGLFLLFCAHCFLLYISYNTPYIYIPHAASQIGIKADMASGLVSIIGVSSTLGQVFMGYIGDHPHINTLHFYVAMISVAGATTLFVPFLSSFIPFTFYCGMYGFFVSANYALTTIILIDLLGMDKLTHAFGIASMAGGVAILVGPPVAGYIADMTESYDAVFYMAGGVILMSGLLLLSVHCIEYCVSPLSNGTLSATDDDMIDCQLPSVLECKLQC